MSLGEQRPSVCVSVRRVFFMSIDVLGQLFVIRRMIVFTDADRLQLSMLFMLRS
jgi:hypothetical protein